MKTTKIGKCIYCNEIEAPREALLLKAINKLSGNSTYIATEVIEVVVNTVTKESKIRYIAEDGGYDKVSFLTVSNEKLETTIAQYKERETTDKNLYYQNIKVEDAPLTTALIKKVSCFKPSAIDLININVKLGLVEIYYTTLTLENKPKRTSLNLDKSFYCNPDPYLKELSKVKEHKEVLIPTEYYDFIEHNLPSYPSYFNETMPRVAIGNYRFISEYYYNKLCQNA